MLTYFFFFFFWVPFSFWQYELCDVFIEVIKPLLAGEDEDAKLKTREVLYNCLEMGLRMLHPVMPFLTEELWQVGCLKFILLSRKPD